MKVPTKRITEIQTLVLHWYANHARSLPWRETHDPYNILMSEIMLQQTQVPRVIPKYVAFLKRFPTMESLANATSADVIREWKGLGYNRRALNLQRAIRVVVTELDGKFPNTIEGLLGLPGIGRYTAGATMNFAFGIDTPAVDTNVRLFIDTLVPSIATRKENDYYEISRQLMPKNKAHIWLHAVMDYTSAELRKNRPKPTKKKMAEKFIGSNRYLRGKTLDELREGSANEKKLFMIIAKPLHIPPDRFQALLSTLEKEGFIHQKNNLLSLVE